MDSRRFQRHYKSELNTLIISVRGRHQWDEGGSEGGLRGFSIGDELAPLSAFLINVSQRT